MLRGVESLNVCATAVRRQPVGRWSSTACSPARGYIISSVIESRRWRLGEPQCCSLHASSEFNPPPGQLEGRSTASAKYRQKPRLFPFPIQSPRPRKRIVSSRVKQTKFCVHVLANRKVTNFDRNRHREDHLRHRFHGNEPSRHPGGKDVNSLGHFALQAKSYCLTLRPDREQDVVPL